MLELTEAQSYARGLETATACWEEFARVVDDAAVRRLPGVTAAVFPSEPERAVYNNAVLQVGLGAGGRAEALEAMETAYADAGVDRFAAWVHESDAAMRAGLEQRGYRIDEVTRAMGMSLDRIRVPRPEIDRAPVNWSEYLRIVGVPPDFLSGADPSAYDIVIARVDGENAATGMAFDHDGDCGIFNVGTLEPARRRGLGTAITALLLHEARDRGCETASLQSTAIGERVYAAVGFRDLGRILEYTPGR
jgi:GNAT superfamily N-acetyltransferase